MNARPASKHEIYIEVIDAGTSLKISAACSKTHEEICFNAPKNTPQSQLEHLALQKLKYVLGKKQTRG